MGRQRMTALPGRHVEVAVLLATRRDRKALRRSERRPLHARHVRIAGELFGAHVEKGCEHRHGGAERVPDAYRVRSTPEVSRNSAGLLRIFGGAIGGGNKEIRPRPELRVEEMQRTLRHERPQRSLVAASSGE